jgi:CRP/FNR family transcriptional regulator, cyclic AMP receptor protein
MQIVDHLKTVPLFQGMTDGALDAVAALANEVEIAEGTTVTQEGEPGDSFYVIVDGQLRISRHGTTIRDLGPGDFVGEISLVDGRPGPPRPLPSDRSTRSSSNDRRSRS